MLGLAMNSIRHRLEQFEDRSLHPAATRSSSVSRALFEAPSPVRTAFQRDRDRVIHSKAFRRLKHKTQMFLAPYGDHVRTRMTHTLEVTQIARTIARALTLNEDLVEAIGLAHDLGHTPFGHAGERALAEVFPGFVHSQQSLRVVDRIEKELGPIALAVLNAGAYSPTYGERLETDNFVNMFRLNVFGTVFGLVPLVARMRHRGFGQVVLMGSVTAYCGLPSAAAYGASKAALNNLAQSLKYDFDKLNIRIQIANPGFVDTPLTAKARFNMPALMPVEKASERLVHGIENGGFEIVFPRRLAWLLKAGTFLPQALFHRIIRKLTGWDQRRFGLERKKSAKREKHSFGQRQ
jgi:short-subunit dehydrogenase